MSLFTKTANDTFAPYNIAGAPRAVDNHDAQVWGTEVEAILRAGLDGDGYIYETKAILDSSLAPAPNSKAWVVLDPIAASNGIYQKFGVSGEGYWERRADLPYSFVTASDAGAGTPNAIQATTSMPVSSSALVLLNIYETNTESPVSVSFNGGAALTIKTNSGNDIAIGGLPSGMIVLGVASGTTFRLVNDQISSAIVAAAEAAAAEAQASADEAAATVAGKANLVGGNVFEGVQSLNTPLLRAQGGVEGGQITFGKPATGTTLEADVNVDLYENQLRMIEGGGDVRGAFFDFEKLSPGVTNEFLFGSTIGANLQAKMAFFGWIRDNTQPALMQWVTDPGAADWRPYFNQCLTDVNAASGGRGGHIILPNRDIPLSYIDAFTYNGIHLEGAYRAYWEGEAYGTRIIALANANDLITFGSTSTDSESFSVSRVRFDCGLKTGGLVYKATRARIFSVYECSHRDAYSFAEIIGGMDIVFEKSHCEAYRHTGLNVKGDTYRVDRLRLNDMNISGAGTESVVTNDGPALALSGQVETVDTNVLRIVKAFQGVRMFSAGGHAPRFITLQNTQIDYCKNDTMRVEAVHDLKMTDLYCNTSLDGTAIYFGPDVRAVLLNKGNITGAAHSAIGFAGKCFEINGFGFQDWSRDSGTHPAIDLVSGFDIANIHDCTFGKWAENTTSGGGAGQRAIRINGGTGRAQIKDNWMASDLHATPIENNGSGTITIGTNPTN